MAVRLAVGVLIGVVGIALTVGKVGGRGLPLVAADLLKFNLGARRYAGSPLEMTKSEPPAPAEARPDPLRLLAKKAAGGVGRAVNAARKKGRAPFRPHSWFGKRRNRNGGNGGNGPNPNQHESKGKKPWNRLLAVAALGLLAVVLLPSVVLADDPDDEDPGWRLDEIYFVPPDPVPGRRIFIERLAVSGDTAAVTLRAAHDLDLKVRVFGGRLGRTLKMGANTSLTAGQSRSYNLTLDGPLPSFTFSWVDSLGRSGAVSLKSRQIPLPAAPGRRRAVRPGADLPRMDAGQHLRRHRLGVHRRDPPGGGPAGVRRPLQPVGARPAGRHRYPHHRKGQRRCRKPPGQCALRPGRRDPLPAARPQPKGGPQPGNRGGPYSHPERAAAAHVAGPPTTRPAPTCTPGG